MNLICRKYPTPIATRSFESCRTILQPWHVRRRYLSSQQLPESPGPTSSKTTDDISSDPQFSLYTVTTHPTLSELKASTRYFAAHSPTFIATHPRFLTLPQNSPLPEVVFLGRSNAGKSSLLNALLCPPSTSRGGKNRKKQKVGGKAGPLSHVSSRPGRTRAMNAFLVGGGDDSAAAAAAAKGNKNGWDAILNAGEAAHVGRMVVLDMPGYGHASRKEWGEEIVKYLTRRKQLRRIFLLLPAHHKPTKLDLALLSLLREHNLPHQIVISKADRLMREPSSPPYHLRTKLLETLRLGTSAGLEEHASSSDPDASSDASARRASVTFFGDVLGVACGPTSGGLAKKEYGIEELRWTVLQAAGLDGWALRKKGRRRVKTPVPVGTAEEKEDDVDAHEEEEELTEEDVSEK